MTSVAVLGTGLLGTAIATRLLEQGLNVNVWNRDPSRVSPLVERGAKALEDPQHAAENLQTCRPSSPSCVMVRRQPL